MSNIKQEFIKAVGGANRFLRCELYYSLGGYNFFTYKNEPRGYYVSVTPVEREQRNGYTMESVALFSGVKVLVCEVNRKSKKAEEEALARYDETKNRIINSRFADMVEQV